MVVFNVYRVVSFYFSD